MICLHRPGADDHPIPDLRARQYPGIAPDPDIVADHGVRPRPGKRSAIFVKAAVENGEWKAGKPVIAVIGRGRDKADTLGDLAEFANDQAFGRVRIKIGGQHADPVIWRVIGAGIAVIARLKTGMIKDSTEKHGTFMGRAVRQEQRKPRVCIGEGRGNSLAASMSDYLSSRLEADPSVTIHYGAQVSALRGDRHLKGLTLKTPDGIRDVDTCGLFLMVGAAPNTDWLSGLVALNERGFVLTGQAAGVDSPYATSCPGIFAVGDVRAGSVKRVASAVGEGSVVISKVWEHVNG